MSSSRAFLLRQLLTTFYRPAGHRLGILVPGDCPGGDAAIVADVLTAHGHSPERRLARLRPRPGETGVPPAEVADFLRRYGHEYGAAWLPAVDPATGADADVELVTAAAREAGCPIGWDLGVTGEDPEPWLRGWGVDFALWSVPGGDGARHYTREPYPRPGS
ncbi:hypothetical protein [Streptosporangium sp. NPDC051022]|uniref:hypothetical protein n=1 Tax=Streptosporangium sp. NPDC051022 TaxID=3155752 RepID=UPI00341C1AAE